jgi:hypothetical protein
MLLFVAAGLGQPGHVAQIDRGDFRLRRELRQLLRVPGERANRRARREKFAGNHGAELAGSADNEHARSIHEVLRRVMARIIAFTHES